MRENRTYGSVRGGQSNLIPSTRLTRLTVSRSKGRPFYGQAMGQLRLTCTFSAECAQREGCGRRPSRRRGAIMIKPYNRASPEENHSTAPLAQGKCPPPFGGWRHHLSPASGGTMNLPAIRPVKIENHSRPMGGNPGRKAAS